MYLGLHAEYSYFFSYFKESQIFWIRGLSKKQVPSANIAAAALRSRWCACASSLLILWQGTDAICIHSGSVYASCCVFIMFKKSENPAACEMRSVIRFLKAKNMKSAEIHRQRCDVCTEYAMSSSMVRRWVRLFNEGREYVHDDPRSGRPSVVNEDLVCTVKAKSCTVTGLEWPRGFQEVKVPRFHDNGTEWW